MPTSLLTYRRNPYRRTMRAVFAIAALGAAGACSSGGGPVTRVGTEDRPRGGHITVDEAGIAGAIEGGTLRFDIPITANEDASGRLHVQVLDVGGSGAASSSSVAYGLRSGDKVSVHVEVPKPAGLVQQADLVKWNVRVDDGSDTGLWVTRSLLYVVPPYEVRLEGPSTVVRSKPTSYRVIARNMRTGAPIEGLPLELKVGKEGAPPLTYAGTSSATGDAVFPVHVEETGDYQVSAAASGFGLSSAVQDGVKVADPGAKVLLTSDKPLYKPGQTLHLRALALGQGTSQPVANAAARFEIEDGKGNRIFKKSVSTDAFGIATATFTFGQLVNMGTFKLRAVLGEAVTEKSVTVAQYALPKFDLALSTDKTWYRPGDVISGTIDARYFFGKPVGEGGVVVEASSLDVGKTLFQRVVGKLDAQGHYQFSVQLPRVLAGTPLGQGNAAASLHIAVTDTAGQEVDKDTLVTVAPSDLHIVLVPESTAVVPGVDNEMMLFVTDPLGAPVPNAPAEVRTPDGATLSMHTDAFGQADFQWPAPAEISQGMFSVVVSPSTGTPVSQTFTFTSQAGKQHLVVRTDKAIYRLGDTATVELRTTNGERSIYVDWLNNGQAVDMRTVRPENGVAHFSMPIDGSLKGSNQINAYVVDDDGNVVRAGRTVFAQSDGSLVVSMSADRPTYAPGQPAKLTFSVQDELGRPAVAALGVQIVDQAVFSLIDAHPGLLKTFFELEDTFAKPTYEIAGPGVDLGQLLFQAPTLAAEASASQNLGRATFAALGNHSILGIEHGSWKSVLSDASTALVPTYDMARASLLPVLKAGVTRALSDLRGRGCTPEMYYCAAENTSLADAISRRLVANVKAFDFWGNAFQLTSGFASVTLTTRGPDELTTTSDDHPFTFQLSEIDPSLSTNGVLTGAQDARGNGAAIPGAAGAANIGGAAGTGAGGSSASGGAAGGGDSPRVRQDFPETLYVNPAVITGPDGTASIDLSMADSITQWRVSTLANASDGRLGGNESGITVFQDFFVDINFPATLTRGDQVEFPIAIYNYLSVPQTVRLDLQAEDWFTPLGAVSKTVDLAAGQVTGTSFPVRVDRVGLRTLTVKAQGATKSDAVARAVRVLPDGKLLSDVSSGLLAPGSASHTFSFPSGAVAGSGQLYVEVYPAFLAQAVGGMDSMLRQPYGCFEQTTSTTWPNVLVTAYMQKTHQITPEIELKAEALISAGYQRLLTFEHPGGGFSWFGTQDPAPYLSVTAFGLMEFADMKQVADVDQAMIDRTLHWLVAQQQADGSWKGDMSEFFSFHTSGVRNTAFVVWALASNGYQGPEMGRAVAYLKSGLSSEASPDGYTLAMVANALQLAAPTDPATAKVMSDLAAQAKTNGDKTFWDSAGTQTCFYGSGNDAAVTTTALALHALLLGGQSTDAAQGALKYLVSAKDASGNFGSTQATIWTLRSLLLAASKGTKGATGALTVSVDGAPVQTLDLTADQADVLTTVDLSNLATTGAHAVTLGFEGEGQVSYNSVGKYNIPWAQVSEPAGPLSINVSYDKSQIYINEMVRATVSVRNNTSATQNMVLVTVGIPPGFAVQETDLDAYLANRVLSKYEVTGKQLILYVSLLRPSGTLSLSYQLLATMPVKASDGGGEVKLYYEPAQAAHAPAVTLEALAR